MMKNVYCYWMAALCTLSYGAQGAQLEINIAYGDLASPPYFLENGSNIPARPGASIELLREAAANCQLTPRLSRLPNLRLIAMMSANQLDAAAMYSYQPDRNGYFVYPMRGAVPERRLRMTSLIYSLYVVSTSPVQWNGTTLLNLKGTIGANIGWSIAKDLRSRGLPVEEATSTEINFKKLAAGHIAAYATQDHIGDRFLTDHGQGDFRKLQPPLSVKDYYLVFSQQWYQRHPAAAACLWQQVGILREKRLPELLSAPWNQP
jgi:polar amino acid transport system substrate-binding protein